MSENEDSKVLAQLKGLLDADWLQDKAKALGVVTRVRKVDIVCLVWTLILGFGGANKRSLTSLRQAFERYSGIHLSRSSFYERLNQPLLALLKACYTHLLEQAANRAPAYTSQALLQFTQIVAIDSTVLAVWELLGHTFPSTVAGQAKIKLHLVYNVINGRTGSVHITDGKTSDQSPFRRVGKWVSGHLLLFDLGYYNFNLFRRIDQNKGWFVTRAKTNFNGLIVGLNQTVRGRPTRLVGQRVQDVLGRLKRGVLDVQVEVGYKKRVYRGKVSGATTRFRLVGLWNAENECYHLYLTNLPPSKLDADVIGSLYALRWQVEILMKALKSHHRLHQLPTQNETIVRLLIWASLVSLLTSRLLLRFVREQVLPTRHIPHLRFSALFERLAQDLLRDLLAERRRTTGTDPYMDFILHEAFDPNLDRFQPRFIVNRC